MLIKYLNLLYLHYENPQSNYYRKLLFLFLKTEKFLEHYTTNSFQFTFSTIDNPEEETPIILPHQDMRDRKHHKSWE